MLNMLHWLQSALPKRNILLIQLFCISLFLHVFLMFVLTLISYFTDKPISFTVHTKNLSGQAIYFMPLVRTVNASPAKKSQPIKTKESHSTKIISKTEAKVEPIKKENKKVSAKSFQIIEPDPKIKKMAQNIKQPNALKNLKLEIPDLTKLEIKTEVHDVDEIKTDKLVNQPETEAMEALILGREDLVALQIYTNIQNEISQYWKPPIGLSRDLECDIKASIDGNGKISKISVEKCSGVLIYDTSARMAFMQAQMPKEVYGKEIILTFKQ